MITIISGKPGVGKTALNTYFCEKTYQTEREWILRTSRTRIEALNEENGTDYTLPSAPPIYTNFEVKFNIGYKKSYSPYFINPYYLGLPNERLKVQSVPPNSRIFISEAQRYYNSRKSQTLPDWVSRWYEMHRHYGINVFMDVQRVKLIDLNIRELCKRYIEVQRMEHETSSANWILRTTWHCREFECMQDFDEYLDGQGTNYVETQYVYEGNIFECFNSTSCFNEFLPPTGADFDYLPYPSKRGAADENTARLYSSFEPAEFRKSDKTEKAVKTKKQVNENADRQDKRTE